MSILEQIDLSRQVKRDLQQFVLPYEAGGTGRLDGAGTGIIRLCGVDGENPAGTPVKIQYRGGAHGSGDNVIVQPVSAITDIPFGVMLEASPPGVPEYEYERVPVVVQGSAQVLATGPISAGQRLYPTATGRLSATRPPNNEGWSMGRAMGAISGAVDGTVWMLVESVADRVPFEPAGINLIMGAKNTPLLPGIVADVEVPLTGTIESVRMFAMEAGSAVVDIWKDTYGNFPPTVADSICAAATPTLSSAVKSQDTTLTGWNRTLNKGDILRYNVDSASTIERLSISLIVIKEVG